MAVDLVDRVHGALLMAAVSVGSVLRGDTPDFPGVEPLHRDKVLGETGLLLRAAYSAAQQVADETLRAKVQQLADVVASSDRGADLMARLCVRPTDALDEAFTHLHLRALGLVDEAVDALLEVVLAGDAHRRVERLPTRAVEQRWLWHLWRPSDATLRDATFVDSVVTSVLGRALDPTTCSLLELYSFTHLILYATDGGRGPLVLPRPLAEVAADAEVALAVALDLDNLDLAAEVLWAWPMLGLRWTPLARFAWSQIADAADALGFLPGPGYRTREHTGLDPVRDSAYVVATSYHATVVLGILSASMLLSGRRPPDRAGGSHPAGRREPAAPETAGRASLTRSLRGLLLPGPPGTGQWVAAFDALGESEKAALVAMLITVTVRRAARHNDVDLMRRVLELTLEHGLSDHAAVPYAITFLRSRTALMQLRTPG